MIASKLPNKSVDQVSAFYYRVLKKINDILKDKGHKVELQKEDEAISALLCYHNTLSKSQFIPFQKNKPFMARFRKALYSAVVQGEQRTRKKKFEKIRKKEEEKEEVERAAANQEMADKKKEDEGGERNGERRRSSSSPSTSEASEVDGSPGSDRPSSSSSTQNKIQKLTWIFSHLFLFSYCLFSSFEFID